MNLLDKFNNILPKNTKHQPFIIWTFRRVGGTNFANTLFEHCNATSFYLEPFNINRVFGSIHTQYRTQSNKEALRRSLFNALEKKPVLKHCLEMSAPGFNEVLLEVTQQLGYKHLFLYREHAKSRLLSLNFSFKTNIWQPTHFKTRTFEDKIFSEYIDCKKLINHEYQCRKKMSHIYNLLDASGNRYALSFETLYKKSKNESLKTIDSVYNFLNIGLALLTKKEVDQILQKGSLNSQNLYTRFPNSSEFIKQLETIPTFNLQNN